MRDVQAKLGQVVMNDVANKPISPLNVDEVVRVTSKCTIPPFSHKAIHEKVNLILHDYKMNMMTHGLEKRSPSLLLGIEVQTVYATLADGSNRVMVVLRNNTRDWLEIKKGGPIAWMVAANEVPKVTNLLSAEETKEQSTLTEAERQDLLLEKLDLTGLEAWPEDQAGKVCSLLKEYHDIFSLEKHDMGHTNATKHKIVLKDPDTPSFKECFHRILPPQLDEVREHLKLMLDAGVIWPSNSPWCNAVVLVRKKDGSLHFRCRDSLRRINGEVSIVVIRYDDSSYILWVKPREGLVKVNPSLLAQLVPFSPHLGCLHRRCWPADERGAWCIWPSGSSTATPQALFCLGRGRPSGYLWPPKETNTADEP